MINVHGLRRNVKNVVKNYSDAQIKVREATSNDPWGPSGTLMSEIADLTYNVVAFSEIMQVIWKRLNDHGKNWKHVYKALMLLEYLLKSGSERVGQQCKENIFAIDTLKDFQHVEDNKDQGINVREKAKQLVVLLRDGDRLKNERARALKARERFAQASSQELESSEFLDQQASFDEVMLTHGAVFMSDLERVRPQTIGEEELQLQLALAMSKEEADQAERLKRNDDLRLQMALSESKEAFEQKHVKDVQNKKKPSAMEDLFDVFVDQPCSDDALPTFDAWGVAVNSPKSGKPMCYSQSFDHSIGAEHPNREEKNGIQNNNAHFPGIMENSPDLISSTVGGREAFDMSSLKKSLSVDMNIALQSQEKENTPKKFLGENANLVNLDSLMEYRSPASNVSVNPFSAPTANPFQATKTVRPSINEIRAQHNSFSSPSTLPRLPPHHCIPRTDPTFHDTDDLPSNNPFS